jgi:hypothetical protein
MFRGGKTFMFWIGLIMLSLASVGLSTILWLIFVYYPAHYHALHWDYPTYFPTYFWQYYVWYIVGAAALIGTGLCMMKFGLKKEKSETLGSPKLL